MDNPSVEELITQFISITQEDVDRAFQKGEIACYLTQMGYSYTKLASEVKCSAEQIRVLVRTYEAFPRKEDRNYPELEFYYYRLAARTDDPHGWLEKAVDNEWSTRELAAEIKSKPIGDDRREAERVLYKVQALLEDEALGPWFREQLAGLLNTDKIPVKIS